MSNHRQIYNFIEQNRKAIRWGEGQLQVGNANIFTIRKVFVPNSADDDRLVSCCHHSFNRLVHAIASVYLVSMDQQGQPIVNAHCLAYQSTAS